MTKVKNDAVKWSKSFRKDPLGTLNSNINAIGKALAATVYKGGILYVE